LKESGIPQTRGINSASGLIMSCISEAFRTPTERTKGMSIPKERLCLISILMGSGGDGGVGGRRALQYVLFNVPNYVSRIVTRYLQ
jgi:hypothetical protein